MGSKEFALGAELALRQAGVTDDRMKQQLIAQVTQANLARAQQEMGMQQQQQAELQEISKMFEPRQEPVSQWEPSFGTRTVTPEVDMNQLAMKLIPHAPAQALQALARPDPNAELQGKILLERVKAALGGYKPQTEADALRLKHAGKPETNVSVPQTQIGTIPQGYSLEYDDKGRPVRMAAIPGGPAAGEISAREKKTTAQKRVTNILTEMEGLYKDLDKLGGIVSTEKDAPANVAARMGATGIGQSISGAVGSEIQSIRNKINQMRPLLINHIRQASEMGARGLDSEKELEFYLQAATNPALDVQANLNALRILDDAYGLGIFNGKKTIGKYQVEVID